MNTDWIYNLFMGTGVAHSVLLVALVIAAGLFLSRIKIAVHRMRYVSFEN